MRLGVPALLFAAFCAGCFFCTAPARAAAPCPNVLTFDAAPLGAADRTFAYRIVGAKSETVSGTIIADTDSGFYSSQFSSAELKQSANADVPFMAQSADVFVEFPVRVHVARAWLSTVSVKGDSSAIACEPTGDPGISAHFTDPPAVRNIPSNIPRAKPLYGAAYSTNCAVPFSSAHVTDFAGFPMERMSIEGRGIGGEVVALVDLDERAKVTHIEILDSAGPVANADFERVIRMSRYAPAIAYCRAVPSSYLLRSEMQ